MKIPTVWKEQHDLYFSKAHFHPCTSDFQFIWGEGNKVLGMVETLNLHLSSEDEGRLLFFPAWLVHQVFPFYGTEEDRITVSGNIVIQKDD